jgi:molybdopterin converting factor small subunit
MSDLNAAESIRVSNAREDADRRQDEISQRIAVVDDLRENVIAKLREITEAHQEMGARLRAELDRFMSDLNAAESIRVSNAREDADRRQDEISQRIAVVDNLRSDLVAQLQEMAEAHQQMGKQLRIDLDQFMSGLSHAESNRKAVTQAYLSEVQADNRETAAAWKELIQRIQAARAASPSVVTKAAETTPSFLQDEKKNTLVEKSIAPSQTVDAREAHAPGTDEIEVHAPGFVEESVVSSQVADELEIHAPGDDTDLNREDLRERIVSILRDHKDGMKMMHIAESLGIENWRSLIPIMRELLDEGALAKDGSLYFG